LKQRGQKDGESQNISDLLNGGPGEKGAVVGEEGNYSCRSKA